MEYQEFERRYLALFDYEKRAGTADREKITAALGRLMPGVKVEFIDDLARARALDRARDRALALDLDRARDLALDRDLDRARDLALDRDLDRALALDDWDETRYVLADGEIGERWVAWLEACEAGARYAYVAADNVYVCEIPEIIHYDAAGHLHSDTGVALRQIGEDRYYIHGVEVPGYVITEPDSITVAHIQAEANTEVRRVMIDRYGQGRYLIDAGAELVHSDGYGDLYRAAVPDDEPLVMVKVVNSTPEADGSYKDYFIRVPPGVATAEQAIAWTGGAEAGQFEFVSES